ncbi:MAG: 50S ribosomal protein L13 [Bdellovibrionales bacterium]|nr:50S ribosomal protein L13 [Bdellovibrionales bacterium]
MTTKHKTKIEAQQGRKWLLVDAEGITLGRLATEVASLVRGKHKATFSPHTDGGDFVIVVNADKVKTTGNKLLQKKYYQHSGYIGGLKETSLAEMLAKHPARVIEKAVFGMLPKNRLGRAMKTQLKVYAGAEHPHSAQQPEAYQLKFV